MDLKQVHEYAEELDRRLRLRTFPLAIKMIEREDDIPRGAKRPLRDFGGHFDLCQLFATSRRSGSTIFATKDDNWCCEPVIGELSYLRECAVTAVRRICSTVRLSSLMLFSTGIAFIRSNIVDEIID